MLINNHENAPCSRRLQYYTRKPMADEDMEKELMALTKDCHGRQQTKKAANEVHFCLLLL
jgi:hypothetical protein